MRIRGEVPDFHACSGRVTSSFSQFRYISVMHAGTDSSGKSTLLNALCANMSLSSSGVCKEHISPWPVWPLQMTPSSEQSFDGLRFLSKFLKKKLLGVHITYPTASLRSCKKTVFFSSQKGKLGTQTGDMVSLGLRHWGVSHRAALPAWCCSPQLCTRVDSLLTESFRSLRPVESTVSVFLAFPSQSWAKHRRISLAICESLDCPRFSFSYLEESWCWGWNLGPRAFYVIL